MKRSWFNHTIILRDFSFVKTVDTDEMEMEMDLQTSMLMLICDMR